MLPTLIFKQKPDDDGHEVVTVGPSWVNEIDCWLNKRGEKERVADRNFGSR